MSLSKYYGLGPVVDHNLSFCPLWTAALNPRNVDCMFVIIMSIEIIVLVPFI